MLPLLLVSQSAQLNHQQQNSIIGPVLGLAYVSPTQLFGYSLTVGHANNPPEYNLSKTRFAHAR
jgi:hypothetical protein